ncbi:MAG: glycosyltransferase family 2 protein [Candidatus Peregrinibacteria bacterium]|nr:glycosyltransferase family 2 protein [Candidatus Peregrinibacteria bacterium]
MGQKLCVIIILNLNGRNYTKNCLNSIKKNTFYKNYKVVVVDNNSTDGSQGLIKSRFKWVDLIENKKNRGFSGGNNDGIKYAIKKYDPSYLYLLNNDTLVKKKWLTEAIKTMNKSDKIGIVGSKQLNFNEKSAISAGWIRPWGINYYQGNIEKDVDWVSGAGFLVRRGVFKKIGLIDEIYNPAYYEETDFEKRAMKSGFKVIHSPKSIFLHKGGVTSNKEINNFSELFYRNRFIYFIRNHGIFYFLPRMLFDCFREFRRGGFSKIIRLFYFYKKGYILIKEKNNLIKKTR